MAVKGVLERKHYVVAGLLREQLRRRRSDNQVICRVSRTKGFRSAPSGAVMKIRTPALAWGIYVSRNIYYMTCLGPNRLRIGQDTTGDHYE